MGGSIQDFHRRDMSTPFESGFLSQRELEEEPFVDVHPMNGEGTDHDTYVSERVWVRPVRSHLRLVLGT